MSDAMSATRRTFLKQSTAAVAGAALAGSLNIQRAAYAAGSDTIKLGLVGCGGRGTGAANQAMNTDGPTKLVAVGDAFEDNLKSSVRNLAKEHKDKVDVPADRQFVGFDAYKKVIDSDVDLVILATPPGFRPLHFAYAIEKGKHVFMEKPVATDAAGVRTVLAAAEEAKKKNLAVAVGLQRRHEAQYIDTIKQLQDGVIGDINFTRVYWNNDGVWVRPRKPEQTEMEYQMRNWYYFTWLCGDHIVEQHIHNLDVINWLKNAYPVKAQGQGGRQVRVGKEFGEIYDHHMVEYTYADGSVMLSQCRHIKGCWSSVSEYAHGSKGTCDISGHSITINGEKPKKYTGTKHQGHQQEHHDLFARLRKGERPNEAEYGAKSTMTAILGRLATYSGKEVKWDEALNSKVSLMPQNFDFKAQPPVLPDSTGMYPCAIPGVSKVV